MGAIQSGIGGVIGAAIGAVGATKIKDIADSKKEGTEAPKTDMAKIKKEAEQNRITMNKVIDKAAEANRISMEHVEARRTQSDTFKERLEAVKTGNWKATRAKLKLKRRGGK